MQIVEILCVFTHYCYVLGTENTQLVALFVQSATIQPQKKKKKKRAQQHDANSRTNKNNVENMEICIFRVSI